MTPLCKSPLTAKRFIPRIVLLPLVILLSLASLLSFPLYSAHASGINNTVDWSNVQYSTTGISYGLNAYSGVDTSIVTNSSYGSGMTTISAGMLRFHRWDMIDTSSSNTASWMDATNRTWNANRISTVFNAVDGWYWNNWYSPTRLVNIPGWPSWMATYNITDSSHNNATVASGLLSTNEFTNYANFCAQLVRILNVDQHRGIKYFEILNEEDQQYYVNVVNYNARNGTQISDKLDELISLYNQVAKAMKAVDSSIEVGGPAFNRPDLTSQVQRFVNGTDSQGTLDFLTAHSYASYNLNDSDASIYGSAQWWGSIASTIRGILDGKGHHIDFWWDEFNISSTWTNNDSRMRNNKGAVFDALAITGILDGRAEATAGWNDGDNIYGKLDPNNSFSLRPGGQLLKLLNTYMIGRRVQTSTDTANTVIPFAVHSQNHFAYLLINRTGSSQTVNTSFSGWSWGAPNNLNMYQISSSGYSSSQVNYSTVTSGLSVPDNSVTLLVN